MPYVHSSFGPLIKIVLIILTLIVWPLNPQDRALFNVIAGVWGMVCGMERKVGDHSIGFYGGRGLEYASLAIGFFITHFTTVNQYLAASFVLLLIGILCYFFTELLDPLMASRRREGRELSRNSVVRIAARRTSIRRRPDGKLVRKKSRRQSPSTRQDAKLKAKDGRY
ncbi:Protein unc-93-like protein A [Aphelenchoides fujianensis]|nr:Protein unc-93-like protein A [Aphelenchoides fujianensis]